MFERYKRQMALREIGEKGQLKLKNSKALVVGAGGLGSAAIYYLAAAGIGHIGICDNDTVALSNLNRQIIHFESDIGRKKIDSAKEKINRFASDVSVLTYDIKIDEEKAAELFTKYDIVLSCVDNMQARKVLNRAHIKTKTPLIDAGVNAFSGYVFPIISGYPCYNCVFPADIEAANNGIIGAAAGTVGSVAALEAIMTLLDINRDFYGKMLFIDLLDISFDMVQITKNESCICNEKNTE